MYSFRGTGTYVIGHINDNADDDAAKGGGRGLAVVDPGPALPDHVETIKRCLRGYAVTHIFITHTHLDHSPAAQPLKMHWKDAKTCGYGPHGSGVRGSSGRDAAGIENNGDPSEKKESGSQLKEGADLSFVPDITCRDGDIIQGDGWTIECVHTPGHTSNHMCFALKEERALFTGDHVMGWSTTVISPPDGNMKSYMDSLGKLLNRSDDRIYYPTHGTSITDVKQFVRALVDHRLEREKQILDALRSGCTNIGNEMVPAIYADTDPKLYHAAARSVLAAMIRLVEIGQVVCDTEEPALESVYTLPQSLSSIVENTSAAGRREAMSSPEKRIDDVDM